MPYDRIEAELGIAMLIGLEERVYPKTFKHG